MEERSTAELQHMAGTVPLVMDTDARHCAEPREPLHGRSLNLCMRSLDIDVTEYRL